VWFIVGFFAVSTGFYFWAAARSAGRKRYRNIAASVVSFGAAVIVALVHLGVDGGLLAPIAFIFVVPAALYYKIAGSLE
jgi:hypothetical protein